MKNLPLPSWLLALVMAVVMSPGALAADSAWINPDGGLFHSATNWDNGVPGPTDGATFDLGTTYEVTFTQAVLNDLLSADDGDVTFDLSFVTYTVTEALVGNRLGDVAVLTLRNGTIAVNDAGRDLRIGKDAGAIGTLEIANDAILTSSATLIVGDGGNGTLTVRNGGTVASGAAFVADDGGSTGNVTVTGADTSWTSSGQLFLGNGGNATMMVTLGGTATTSAAVRLGDDVGAHGLAQVTGVGSTWECPAPLTVGNFGTGAIELTGGGTLTTQNAFIADDPGSSATVLVSGAGSSWMENGVPILGNSGSGTLDVLAGGSVTWSGLSRLADDVGSDGTVHLAGAGSAMRVFSELFVGNLGTGTIEIETGGRLESAKVKIGDETGAIGIVTIDGAGSIWADTVEFIVGNFGSGDVTVTNGGTLSAAILIVGDDPGSDGTVELDGSASSIDATGAIRNGNLGAGTLRVVDGGSASGASYAQTGASSLEVVLGPASGAAPAIDVTGTATIDGTLDVALQDGFSPPSGSEFDLITGTSVNGAFDSITAADGLTVMQASNRVYVVAKGGDPCPADLDGNGDVGFNDLLLVLAAWGPCPGCPEDLDGNDDVGFNDLLIVLSAWGVCP